MKNPLRYAPRFCWLLLGLALLGLALPHLLAIEPPPGVELKRTSATEPNFDAGGFGVVVSAIPRNKMPVVKYVFSEYPPGGLKHAVQTLKDLPALVFLDVSEDDASRMLANLETLGCEAAVHPMADVQHLVPAPEVEEEPEPQILTLQLGE